MKSSGGLLRANFGDLGVHRLQLVGGLLIVLIEHAGVDVHARIVGEEFLLLGGAFVGGRVEGGAQLLAQSRFEFLEMLRQALPRCIRFCFVVLFVGQFLRFGFDSRPPSSGRRRCRARSGAGRACASSSSRRPARTRRAAGSNRSAESDRSDDRGTGRSRPTDPSSDVETILIVSATTWLRTASRIGRAGVRCRRRPCAGSRWR